MDPQNAKSLSLELAADGTLALRLPGWAGLVLEHLRPALRCDGVEVEPAGAPVCNTLPDGIRVDFRLPPFTLELRITPAAADDGLQITSVLVNASDTDVRLDDVALLRVSRGSGPVRFGTDPRRVRILEQGNYWGQVRPLASSAETTVAPPTAAGEPGGAPVQAERGSDLVWVAYDQDARQALLVGFVASERWLGRIQLSATAAGEVAGWRIGFDGGALSVDPRQRLELEPFLLLRGTEPLALLATYADAVQVRHRPAIPAGPVVSWCSWYPYRLGVTEERILAEARIAAQRLRPLGLKIIEVDLGWESGNLPCSFTENERFPHGLKWLAEQLRGLGLELGAWKAPFTISEFDPLAIEHPDWLIQDETGKPLAYWEWFWEPHGKVFILDLTHPGALQWLQERIQSLTDRGVRYLKFDFIGCAADGRAKRRHDVRMVAGGGTEAARRAAAAISAAAPDALILNCGGPEQPGTGQWPLLYVCNDTGNSGFIAHSVQAANYEAVATHLFKNKRWGLIQPSCLVTGLPGTLDDARLRATVAFLTGGQVDISDTLTTLPEDRWQVLTATLPPAPATATPVDLFEPLQALPFDYEGTCRGQGTGAAPLREYPPASVWHLHVKADWDEWDLVAVFCYDAGSGAAKPGMSRYVVPFARLGITDGDTRTGFEFWSGQFLGAVPGQRRNPGGYVHPGDYQDLVVGDGAGTLDLAFFGPGVKLVCLRRPRPHPWVAGTSFHQSCGLELRDVRWDPETLTLRGDVRRPAGEAGFVVITAAGRTPVSAEVDARPVSMRPGAGGCVVLPVVVGSGGAPWRVRFTAENGRAQ